MEISASADELKNQIVSNQRIIDQLNADLVRKAQEVHIIQEISVEINTTLDLDTILNKMLLSLDRTFNFKHSMVLLPHADGQKLSVAASHGYEDSGIGAEVKLGEGIIGVVAKRKKLMRIGNIGAQMAYVNVVKEQLTDEEKDKKKNIKIPGLPKVQSQVAIPLLVETRLVGVLAVESTEPNLFDKRDELIITILADQAASAIEKARAHTELKHINDHLEELVEHRTSEIVAQKKIIEEKNKSILDSIRYAERIQGALLTPKSYLEEHLKDHFVFYKPKDIVSGDFYWANQKGDKLFFAVIDCTGHGVPGALMSIVAHANLQRAVVIFELQSPADILNKLNETVISLFSKSAEVNINDGMDVALCSLDRSLMKLEFAGANNPMYLVRNGELIEYKGDKQPIGNFISNKDFTNNSIDVQKDDCIYFLTDGYADQFGGPAGKKFMYKQLKNLLLANSEKPMQEQGSILVKAFADWKGDLDQVDDVCLLGIRI
jgi:serine phosphatase RsbU (regulator of sigma subunit)